MSNFHQEQIDAQQERDIPFQRKVCDWFASDEEAAKKLLLAIYAYKRSNLDQRMAFEDPYDDFDMNTVAWQLLRLGVDRPLLVGLGIPVAIVCNIITVFYCMAKAILFLTHG